jgi:arylsulfatase A-like enzyme
MFSQLKGIAVTGLAGLLVLLSASTLFAQETGSSKPNVLFIAVDDLNDWTGVLGGHPQTRTPHIDRLASKGMLFTNAHTAAPACNPSRVALMTGLYPTTTGVYLNSHPWRPVLPDAVTLPQYFTAQGYKAMGAGKIYHGRYPDPASWNYYFPSQTKNKPDDPVPDQRPVNGIPNTAHFDWGPVQVDDQEMGDAKVAEWVIGQLQASHEKPFFLACGIFRPHLPWYVPQSYFDDNPLEAVILPVTLDNDLDDIPPAGVAMARPERDHKNVLEYNQWNHAVRGYLASITFADKQVGKVIQALEESDYSDNTIVVLWIDHGWHLGEKSHWRKFSLWERSTRVTFMIVAPGIEPGSRTSRPVNLVDIYPTLIDLAGLPEKEGLDGQSLRPLMESPMAAWNRPALTTHGRGNHTVRDDRWRYIRYADGSEELYDHQTDPNEWTNQAGNPNYANIKAELAEWIPKTEAPSAPTRND